MARHRSGFSSAALTAAARAASLYQRTNMLQVCRETDASSGVAAECPEWRETRSRKSRVCPMPLPTGIHPEFGYLAPTPQFRRGLRIAAIAGVAGALFGAASVLALATWHDRASAPAEPTELARSGSAAAEPGELAQVGSVAAEPPGSVLPITTADIARPAAKPCSEQISFDRERKCRSGNSRRWRHIRVVPADSPRRGRAGNHGWLGTTVAPRSRGIAAAGPRHPHEPAQDRQQANAQPQPENDGSIRTAYAASTATRPDGRIGEGR